MKTSKLALVFLTCASGSALAQDGSPDCLKTNFDPTQDMFTVVSPAPGALNQQCFLTVLPAGAPRPEGPQGRFVEGTYEILLSGGGGGGGGGGANKKDPKLALGGQGGNGALPASSVTYLPAGVYRLTIGTGGKGGGAAVTEGLGGNAGDGNPTAVSDAYSGTTIAGFPRAEYWAGRSLESYQIATGKGLPAPSFSDAVYRGSGPGVVNGQDGASQKEDPSQPGVDGGHGFIKMTLVAQAAPQVVTPPPPPPAAAPEPAPAPKPVVRPKRKDRN